MNPASLYLGVDLGGTEIKAVAILPDGSVRWRRQIATEAMRGRDDVLSRLTALVAGARQETAPAVIEAAGFTIPGVLDMDTGSIELLTNFTPEWNGFGAGADLARRTALPVSLLNDVRAATVAEHLWGAGRGFTDFVNIAVGTGIGGGLVIGGQLYLGSRGAAGEIGHQTLDPDGLRCNCGNLGCLETLASGSAITRDAAAAITAGDTELAELTGNPNPEPAAVARAAAAGNFSAQRIFERAGTWIGRALANAVCLLNPQAIVVGGGVARAGELLLRPIRAEIERRTVVFKAERGGVPVLLSPLGGDAGALGAAAWVMRHREGLHLP